MKKFMKAIAFATVMCLALSTAAFAAVEVDYATKTANITVEGAQAGEQVAIIVTEAGATEFTKDTILFVDQKASKTFSAKITKAGVEAIDVYAGYATNNTGEAVLVAEDVALEEEEVLELTITLANVQIVNAITEVMEDGYVVSRADEDTKAAVVKFTLNIANGTADSVAKMGWAFEVKNDETAETTTKYADADATIVAAINSGLLAGSVEIAAALDSTGYTVNDAFALITTVGGKQLTVEE